MSAWSTKRKISIGITVMVIIVFIVSGILFAVLYQPPSCDDGIQNGLETGIDCGGICKNFCPEEPKKLLDVWTRPFLVAEGVYAAVAYIENQNEELYVPEVQYEIELYDRGNRSITRTSKKTTIMPNGITPIFVPHIVTGERQATSASFRFTEKPSMVPQPNTYDIDITDVRLDTPEKTPPYIYAVATNNGKTAVKRVDLVVVIYDEDGIAIAASKTFEKNIKPQEARAIQYSWVHPFTLRKGECPGGYCRKEVGRAEIIPIITEW